MHFARGSIPDGASDAVSSSFSHSREHHAHLPLRSFTLNKTQPASCNAGVRIMCPGFSMSLAVTRAKP